MLNLRNSNRKLIITPLIIISLLFSPLFFSFTKKVDAAGYYTPFGGKVEEYKESSDADCVTDTCGEINTEVQDVIREAVNGVLTTVYTFLATLVPYGTIASAALALLVNGLIEGIKVCDVEEITVGPPKGASIGILNLGVLDFNFMGMDIFTINLGSLLNFSVISPKIYDHDKHKEEGYWVLGNSLNIKKLCEGDDAPDICDNAIADIILDNVGSGQDAAGSEAYQTAIDSGSTEEEAQQSSTDAEEEYANDCPLLNLMNQVGSSPKKAKTTEDGGILQGLIDY
ncbi:MAG: hypothetical protein WDK96_02965 [Candidatus Paceibacterota bacterium]|jgi:hypothetical protein